MRYDREEKTKVLTEVAAKLNPALAAAGSKIKFVLKKYDYGWTELKADVGSEMVVEFDITRTYSGNKSHTIVLKHSGEYLNRGHRVGALPYNVDYDKADWAKVAEIVVRYAGRVVEAREYTAANEKWEEQSEKAFEKGLKKFAQETGLKNNSGYSFYEVKIPTSIGDFIISESSNSLEVKFERTSFSVNKFEELKALIEKIKKI